MGPPRQQPRLHGPAVAFGLLVLALAGPLPAQVLTGDLAAFQHPSYASVASHYSISEFAAGGVSMFEGQVVIFCSDLGARSLDEDGLAYPYTLTKGNSDLALGSLQQLDVWTAHSTPQDEALAIAMALWLVDTHYADYFVTPPAAEAHERQYAFQNALWEIFADGGTTAGLDFTTGNVTRTRFGPGGYNDSPLLWSHMNALIDEVTAAAANSTLDSSYIPHNDVRAALDSRIGYSDYLLVAAIPTPEPAAALLALLAALPLALRRRRH